MNKTDKSKERRKNKSRKATINAIIIIAIILVLAFFIVRAVKNKDQGPDDPSSNVTGQEDNNKDDSEKEDEEGSEISKEDKEKLEAERKEKYGEFYVPLPEQVKESKGHEKVKGLYLNFNNLALDFDEKKIADYEKYVDYVMGKAEDYPESASSANVLEQMLAICNKTEVNGIVIDIKTDGGYLSWDSDIEIVNRLDTDNLEPAFNYEKLLKYMKDHDIRPIARIVTFKDFALPQKEPDHAMHLKDGDLYLDASGTAWVDQYDKFVWDYVLAIAKETALRGFDEIHFDYVRFPDNAAEYDPIVDKAEDAPRKDENIENFLSYAQEELKPYGVEVGAAVFGIITSTWEDDPDSIGQTWIKLTDEVNSMSPMLYPSHYSTGWYGYDVPDYEPYGVLHSALMDAIEKNSSIEGSSPIRPWIQGFTADYMADYMDYTAEDIAEQVRASKDLGIDEYLIWNAANEYDPEIFKYTESYELKDPQDIKDLEDYSYEDVIAETEEGEVKVQDFMGRTPYQAVSLYLDSISAGNLGRNYLMTKRSERPGDLDEFLDGFDLKDLTIDSYGLNSLEQKDDFYRFSVLIWQGESSYELELDLGLEDGIFKVFDYKLNDQVSESEAGDLDQGYEEELLAPDEEAVDENPESMEEAE